MKKQEAGWFCLSCNRN